MRPEPPSRRAVYFAFQGLFLALLLLLAVLQPARVSSFGEALLAVLLIGSLMLVRFARGEILDRWWFQSGLFVGDALVATAALRWLYPRGNLFLLYLFIVFGSALTRSRRQRAVIAVFAIAFYFLTARQSAGGWMFRPEFWLNGIFLAASAALMAVLARDARQAQDEQRRRYEERLVQVGRLATLGRVAGEVAHRIKGPLTTIAVDAEVLAGRHAGDKKTVEELEEIRGEVERCKRILKDLLDLGRIEEMDRAALDLRGPVRAALESVKTQAKRRSVGIAAAGLGSPMRVRGDAALLQEAVAALLQNAIEAVRDGGKIRVEASTSGGTHRVAVVDDGIGIASGDIERIFEPFYTTKKGDGSGLGLSSALRIAVKHGGGVEAESVGLRRGSRFTLSVPAA